MDWALQAFSVVGAEKSPPPSAEASIKHFCNDRMIAPNLPKPDRSKHLQYCLLTSNLL